MAKAKESPARFAQGTGFGLASHFSRRIAPPSDSGASTADVPTLFHFAFALVTALASLGASPTLPTRGVTSNPSGVPPSPLTLLRRTIRQDQGAWVVDYRFKNTGPTDLVVSPDEVMAKVEGWVSNSRIAAHSLPRWSSIAVAKGTSRLTGENDLITASEEAKRCKERLIVSIWPDEPEGCDACPSMTEPLPANLKAHKVSTKANPSAVKLAAGASMRVRLRLEHQHVVYGDYDPLLGPRTVELTVGGSDVRDVVSLDREQYLAQPRITWPEIPEERRDLNRFLSGPDSLHLEAHIPGQQYWRVPQLPVRYDTKMRLRFWYLIAEGTEGDCRLRLTQIRDTPISLRSLSRGDFEQCLKVVGRWTKVERIIRTDPEATHVALEFGIWNDSFIGEMWVDNVSLEPLEVTQAGP